MQSSIAFNNNNKNRKQNKNTRDSLKNVTLYGENEKPRFIFSPHIHTHIYMKQNTQIHVNANYLNRVNEYHRNYVLRNYFNTKERKAKIYVWDRNTNSIYF